MNSRRMIALIAPNWLGDAVMSLPLVGLIGASERAGLSVVAPPSTARVYWRLPGVDELAVLPKRDATRGVRNRAKFLGRARPDAAVILPPSFSSAVGPWLARVPVRVGYRGDGRGGLLTDSLENRDGRKVHLSLGYLKLGEAALDRLGLAAPDGTDPPAVRVGDADHAELEELLDVGALGRYAVLVPGATYGPAKSWPWERYREVARALASDIAVVLAGTPGERDVCDRIVDGVNGAHNLAGRTSLGAFLSLLSRASVVVANDSGSPHLAASMGTPVVVIFGSTSPDWTAPMGQSVEVVRHPVHCSPCFRKTCPTNLECFDGVSVGEVLEKTRAYL